MAISSPSDIPGLAIDLDPHEEAYQDAAGTTAAVVDDPVGNLPDQTANGRDFTQSTSGAKPTLRQDANGWRYVESDGVDDRMNAVSEYLAGRTEATVVVVFVANAITGNHAVMGDVASDNQGWAILVDDSDAGTGEVNTFAVRNHIARGGGGATAAATGDNSISTGTRYVGAGAYDDGDPEAWLDGTLIDTDTTTQSDISTRGTQEAILNGNGFLVSLDGNMYRLLVYDHALTSTEHSDLATFLDGLYSNPVEETYTVSGTVTEPDGMTAVSGATVTLLDSDGTTTLDTDTTDGSGGYSVSAEFADDDLPRNLSVQVTADGFQAGQEGVQVSTSETSYDVDVILVFSTGSGILGGITLYSQDRQTEIRDATWELANFEIDKSLAVEWQLTGTFVEGFSPDAYDTQQVIEASYEDGSFELWRIQRIQRIRENGQPARLQARPLWMDLTHRTATLEVGERVDLTVTITGVSAQDALDRILGTDLGADRSLFRPGDVDPDVNAEQVFIAATNVSHFDLLRTLANRVQGEIECEWDPVNERYLVHIREHVGDRSPGERVISETGARLNRKRLRQDKDGREIFSRVIAVGGTDEAEVQLGDAWWGIESVTDIGGGQREVVLIGDPIFSEDITIAERAVDWDGNEVNVVSVTAPDTVVVDGFVTTLLQFLDGDGNQLTGFTDNTAEADIGRIERRLSISDVAPAANLLEQGGVSVDLSDWSCQGGNEYACGWFDANLSLTITQTTAAQDVQHGTISLNAQGDSGAGLVAGRAPLADREQEGPYVSAWVNLRVISGSVQIRMVDDNDTFFPQGETLTAASPKMQSYALGGFKPNVAGTAPEPEVFLDVRCLEDGTEFVVDAATITQTAEPVPYSAEMGPNAVFRLAGEALQDAGRRPDSLSGLVFDLGSLGIAADDISLGDEVTVELEGQSVFVARVVRVKTRQKPNRSTVEKEITLDRTTPEVTPRITGAQRQVSVRSSAVSGGSPTAFTGVPESRTLTMGSGLLISGGTSANLSQDRTITLNLGAPLHTDSDQLTLNYGSQFQVASGALHIADDAISDTQIAYPLVSVDIEGGAIDDTPIGGNTPASGSFTTLVANTLNTGHGANELYPMDQAVRTSDAVQFSQVTVAGNVLPDTAYAHDIGSPSKKWLMLHAAELRVGTLVAANELVTMGGRQIVGTSTELIQAIGTSDVSIRVRHNNLSNGDWVRLEAGGNVEEMQITSSPTTVSGGYEYTVARDADGTGPNSWEAGDTVVNLGGTAGYGFIDQYAVQSFLTGKTTAGPSTAFMVRTGTGRTDVDVRALSGNLNGWYGFSSDTHGFAAGDPSNGNFIATSSEIALRSGTTPVIRLDSGGNAFVENRVEVATGGLFTNATNDFFLDNDGIGVEASSSFNPARAYTIRDDGNDIVRLWSSTSLTDFEFDQTAQIQAVGSTSDMFLSSGRHTIIRHLKEDETGIIALRKDNTTAGTQTEVRLASSTQINVVADGGSFGTTARIGVNSGSAPEVAITAGDITVRVVDGNVTFTGIPTTPPAVADALWNDGGTAKFT